jgi:adenylate kinase
MGVWLQSFVQKVASILVLMVLDVWLLAPCMQVIIGLLRSAMIKSGAKEFLIDGFPRALDQAECFEQMVKPCEKVIFFDCPDEEMEKRLLKRGETSGRSDDNAETIRKRFRTFVDQSLPVIEHYEKQGKVFRISAVPTPDQVFVEVQKAVEGSNAEVVPLPVMSTTPGAGPRKSAHEDLRAHGAAHAHAVAFA